MDENGNIWLSIYSVQIVQSQAMNGVKRRAKERKNRRALYIIHVSAVAKNHERYDEDAL
jgi:hypothetical protein